MACYNSCCPTPCRYRRTVVVATNTCSPCGGGAYGYGYGLGGCGYGYGADCGYGYGVTGVVYPTVNPIYTNCGWAGAANFGWGINTQSYGPF